MGRQILFIWGGAIFLFLLLSRSSGTVSVLSGLQKFVGGTTTILQGR